MSNIPEAGMAMTALDNLLHSGSAEQLAIIAAKVNSTSLDLHSIKDAIALAAPLFKMSLK
ncbi:Oxaloacetate decarboxylase beta chain [Mannheimia haemolytica]|uniref:Oxaloacetate decarboxylase beta chain n=1 Tax=Mannheimia haemolytica TaxID=75985 RepID=A0A378MVU8_MANHA|nr:Oxaloacetate decarboxylase beta chain [Mannheimia haemolytica]